MPSTKDKKRKASDEISTETDNPTHTLTHSLAITKKRVIEAPSPLPHSHTMSSPVTQSPTPPVIHVALSKPQKPSTTLPHSQAPSLHHSGTVSHDTDDDYVSVVKPKTKLQESSASVSASKSAKKSRVKSRKTTLIASPTLQSSQKTPINVTVMTETTETTETTLKSAVPQKVEVHTNPGKRSPLVVDTPHEPITHTPTHTHTTHTTSNKENTQPVPVLKSTSTVHVLKNKSSWGWVSKLFILIMGFILASVPFIYYRTNDSIALAALSGHPSVLHTMVKLGVNIDTKNDIGETLLLESSRLGDLKIVHVLMKSGSDAEMQNLEGETSLAVALRHGHLKVAQQLVDSGANANTRDKQMETLLCSVIKSGSFSKAKLLIDAGVDVEAKCLAGISPLEMAFNSEDLHIAEILLAAGANVNIAINGGETLLNKAITNNQLEAVQLLLAAGADVEAVGKDGVWKPLLQAAGLGNIDIIRVLLNYHADTEAKNLVSQQILIRILYKIAIPTNMSCMCMYVYHISGPLDPTSIGR